MTSKLLRTSTLFLFTAGCAGGGGGGGGGGPIAPPTALTAFTPGAGLNSVVPGPGTLRIEFTPPSSASFEVAAFVSTDRTTLFAGPPHPPAPNATSLTIGGLTNGVRLFVALGIRPTTGGAFEQTGPSLSVTPGNPVFVDPSAPAGGDGTTPAKAKNNLLLAVLDAFVSLLGNPSQSVNLWLKGGSYTITSTLPVAAGVCIYGGFGPSFDLATRDTVATPTIWNVAAGQFGMVHSDEQLNAGLPVIVDGVRMTGNGVGHIGVDSNSTDPTALELRSVVITDMLDRGLRLRNIVDVAGFDVVLVNCQSSRNGADGLSGKGAFDYSIYNCVFASNVQEGISLKDLTPEPGGVARCSVISSQFFGNAAEGLDCTLGAPLVPTSGDFIVNVRGCSFERNRAAGCLIDGDFELDSGYSAEVVVRECISRGNGGHGFHLDLDEPLDPNEDLDAFVYRVLATSNALDGLYLTSESAPGLVEVSGSAMVGNVGAGLRIEGPTASTGNRAVAVSHCLFASNFGGGMISRDILASACSSIAYQQPNAFDASTVQVGNVSTGDPDSIAFANAPAEYSQVLSRSGAVLNLATLPNFSTAAMLELANDGTERGALTIAGSQVTLTAAPQDFGSPGLLSAFRPSSTSVNEDYRLDPGSIALGAGLNGADAGPFGSPAAGAPGIADQEQVELFYPTASTPPVSSLVPNQSPAPDPSLVIEFSGPIRATSVNGSTVRVVRGATTLAVTLQTSGTRLTILPPAAGWGAGNFRVVLDGVRSTTGAELAGAVVLPFRR